MNTIDFIEIEKIAALAKSGNEEAKEELIRAFKPFIYRVSGNVEIKGYGLEDKVKEGINVLLQCLEVYKPEKCRFVAYATVGIKSFMKYLEKNQDGITASADMIDETIEGTSYFVDKLSDGSFIIKMKNAAKNLTEEERESVEYIYIEGKSTGDYADYKGIPYDEAVKLRNSALKKLRNII